MPATRPPTYRITHKPLPAFTVTAATIAATAIDAHRRDWFRILVELRAHGLTDTDIARALRVRDSTVRNWKYGAEPMHSRGEALLALQQELRRRQQRTRRTLRERERRARVRAERVGEGA